MQDKYPPSSDVTAPTHLHTISEHNHKITFRASVDRQTVHGLMSPPTQYRLYGRRFLQVKRPNQQYQITEGTQLTEKHNKHT